MSAGFVSGGTTDRPRERNELWQKAEEELEAARQRKLEQKNHDGKSLYEVLQENKAAKQDAFEEAAKLKHQFRSLDEDDVAFLNSIRDSESAREREVHQKTQHQLDEFRRLQQEQEDLAKAASAADSPSITQTPDDRTTWQVKAKKKRKREHEAPIKGLKVAKRSSSPAPTVTHMESGADASTSRSTRQLPKQNAAGAIPAKSEVQHSLSSGSRTSPVGGEATSTEPPLLRSADARASQQPAGDARNEVAKSQVGQTVSTKSGGGLLGLGGYSSDDD